MDDVFCSRMYGRTLSVCGGPSLEAARMYLYPLADEIGPAKLLSLSDHEGDSGNEDTASEDDEGSAETASGPIGFIGMPPG